MTVKQSDTLIAFQKDKHIVYVKEKNFTSNGGYIIHHVSQRHWAEYLRLRKETPQMVKMYDTQVELRETFEKKGVLI